MPINLSFTPKKPIHLSDTEVTKFNEFILSSPFLTHLGATVRKVVHPDGSLSHIDMLMEFLLKIGNHRNYLQLTFLIDYRIPNFLWV